MISNICRANFNGGRTAQGNNRFQWDYGQILEISGIENLPDPFTAQFSNTPVLGTAKTAVGIGGRVEIPNEYFVSGQNIYCFIVLHTDEDDGRTVYIATIPVTKRPKPIDDPITPTQQSTIDTAIAALQAGVAKAEGFAGDAEEQAGIAQSAATTATEAAETATGAVADVEAAATRAETAADGAEASATVAEASATDAETAKTAAQAAKDAAETAAANAEQSATDAGNYAGLAEEAEQDAQAAKTAAEASATAAAGSASAASGSASQAAQKASEAASSATAAQTSATNAEAARTGAEAAQAAAETAQASAEEAAENAEQSATTAEWYAERVERFLPTDTASGEIASFPDGADSVPMQSVVVSMEPVQDLHGYDHPWPAGGGENLANKASGMPSSGVTATVAEDGTITLNGTATTATYVVGDFDCKDATATYTWATFNTQAYTDGVEFSVRNADITPAGGWARVNAVNKTFTFTPDTGSAPTLWRIQINAGTTFNQAQFKPMIVKGSTAPTSYAPYENICPISGRTGADIEHTGVNLLNIAQGAESYRGNRNLFTLTYGEDNSVTFTPTVTGSLVVVWKMFIVTKSMVGKTISMGATISGGIFRLVHSDTTDGELNNSGTYISNPYTFTDSDVGIAFGVRFTNNTGVVQTVTKAIVSFGSTPLAFAPYTGENISITFPSEAGTVYGGTLDVVSGELVVDRAMVDFGTLNWALIDNATLGQYFMASLSAFNVKFEGEFNTTAYTALCSHYKVTKRNSSDFVDNTFCLDGNVNDRKVIQIQIKDSRYTDAAEFKAAMSGVMLCYTLAAPITYHLTPQEVRTLLGTNNVWSDAGETAVTYKADVQLYIDKRISALS